MNPSQKNDSALTSMRLHFPEDEARFQWLPLLLEAYAVIDEGVSFAIKRHKEKYSAEPACKKGCSTCCRIHKDIPVYPLELVGIYWFVMEKIADPGRGILKEQLLNYKMGHPCPFLLNDSCAIHPLRPVSCRQFNVFGNPCEDGEDPYYTRRSDVLTPIQNYTNKAFYIMLPFYGITKEEDKMHVIKNNLIHAQVQVLQSLNWKELAKRVEEFDGKSG